MLPLHRDDDDDIKYSPMSKRAASGHSVVSRLTFTKLLAAAALVVVVVFVLLGRREVGPPTRQQLGNSAWTMIHTVAATTPVEPDAAHQEYLINFVYSLVNTFPCEECRHHAQTNIANFPPDAHVGDRDSFVRWACDFHNVVNSQLGKPKFDCEKVDERWGGCGCDMDGKKE